MSNPNAKSIHCGLQRLFSAFPNGWPGLGLLLLRVGIGLRLIYIGSPSLAAGVSSEPITLAQSLIGDVGAVFLLAGLWTPVIGTLVALDELWIALAHYPRGDDMVVPIFLAVLAVSLAMLGPGAWSIDARLFGRRRFDIDRTQR